MSYGKNFRKVGVVMLSPLAAKILKVLPESLLIKAAKILTDIYLKKYANLHIEGFNDISNVEGAKIFICNHLSNSDGIVLNKILKESYDPYFIAGVKLTDDQLLMQE